MGTGMPEEIYNPFCDDDFELGPSHSKSGVKESMIGEEVQATEAA